MCNILQVTGTGRSLFDLQLLICDHRHIVRVCLHEALQVSDCSTFGNVFEHAHASGWRLARRALLCDGHFSWPRWSSLVSTSREQFHEAMQARAGERCATFPKVWTCSGQRAGKFVWLMNLKSSLKKTTQILTPSENDFQTKNWPDPTGCMSRPHERWQFLWLYCTMSCTVGDNEVFPPVDQTSHQSTSSHVSQSSHPLRKRRRITVPSKWDIYDRDPLATPLTPTARTLYNGKSLSFRSPVMSTHSPSGHPSHSHSTSTSTSTTSHPSRYEWLNILLAKRKTLRSIQFAIQRHFPAVTASLWIFSF
jgi:hypothetical protein